MSAGAKTYESDVKEFAGAVHEIFNDSWQGQDYEKLSALVAYKAGGSGDCRGYYSSCATFTIKTATPCTVQVEVDFTSGSGDLVDTVTRSVKVEKGLKGISVSVSTDYSASYYDVKEAKCL